MVDENGRLALVVDDDDTIRKLVGKLLQMDHFTVESAADGAEALEKLHSAEFAVVVLDLMMPHVNGFEVLECLQREMPGVLKKVIILTALPSEAVPSHPVFMVLSKPFEIHALLKSVRDCTRAVVVN